jgi:DNA-binding transcriptional regulator/RsmH inhibitor MraZ
VTAVESNERVEGANSATADLEASRKRASEARFRFIGPPRAVRVVGRRLWIPAKPRKALGQDVLVVAGPSTGELRLFPADVGIRFMNRLLEAANTIAGAEWGEAIWLIAAYAERVLVTKSGYLSIPKGVWEVAQLDDDADLVLVSLGDRLGLMRRTDFVRRTKKRSAKQHVSDIQEKVPGVY